MANLIHKLVKNKSCSRIITTLNNNTPQQLPKPTTPSLLIPSKTLNNANTKPETTSDPKPLFNPKTTQPLQFYPSFPFGYFLNPISSTGFDPLKLIEAEEVEANDDDDARTVWADSVKKKRKKKMNKHKYKKLRKRLRRKA